MCELLGMKVLQFLDPMCFVTVRPTAVIRNLPIINLCKSKIVIYTFFMCEYKI